VSFFSEQDFLRKLNDLAENLIPCYTLKILHKVSNYFSQCVRKLKAILGISVSDHINNIGLDKSKELLKVRIKHFRNCLCRSSSQIISTLKNKFELHQNNIKVKK
jgi:hypothetical protein